MNRLSNSDMVKLVTGLVAFAAWVLLVVLHATGADDLITGCKLYLASLGAYHLKTSPGDDVAVTVPTAIKVDTSQKGFASPALLLVLASRGRSPTPSCQGVQQLGDGVGPCGRRPRG